MNTEILTRVYLMLKNREIHPSGAFDKQGRFYATNSDLLNVRTPSAAYPYSQMTVLELLNMLKLWLVNLNVKQKVS